MVLYCIIVDVIDAVELLLSPKAESSSFSLSSCMGVELVPYLRMEQEAKATNNIICGPGVRG